jgi:hypothetical protein
MSPPDASLGKKAIVIFFTFFGFSSGFCSSAGDCSSALFTAGGS